MSGIERLHSIMVRLRDPEAGCPWDRVQTLSTLKPCVLEETYELLAAMDRPEDTSNYVEELGDVLLQVMFQCVMAEQEGRFTFDDVANAIADKLVRRHPHVFGDVVAKDPATVLKNWEQIKQQEKDGNERVLSGVPDSLPSLIKAYRIQDKARNVGFDWKEKEDVWDKVQEELEELKVELAKEDKEKSTQELGDFLFSVINAARLYKLNPDNALEKTNQKFIRRFNYVEDHSLKQGKNLKDMSLEEMDNLWNEAKLQERNSD